MKKTNDKNNLPVAADKLPAYRSFEEYLKGLLEDSRKAPALYVKASRLEDARKWQRLALAADAKEFAQLAGKIVCLIEADIVAASPPIPPKERGRGHKQNVNAALTFSKATLSQMRRAYPGSSNDVAARCDKAIARGKTPSREMFLNEADIAMNKERIAAVAREKAALRAKPHKSKVQLYALPIQKLAAKVPPESVDTIITDPPYEKAGVHLYSVLKAFGIHALKPGGSLLAFCGSAWLPEIMRRICEDKRLKWQWALKYVMGGGETRNYDRRVFGACKNVLWLVKGKYKEPCWINDKVTVPPKPKGYKAHKWAQTPDGMDAILAKGFAFPGQTLCDPFLGAGSAALAAVHRKCNFIGSDIDPENIKITKDRLAAGWQPEKPEKGGAAEPDLENPSKAPLDIRQVLGLPPEKESSLKRPLESIAKSFESIDQSLKQDILIKELRMDGKIISNFDSEKALKEKEAAKKRELAADQQKSNS